MTRVRNELLATLGRELADEEVAERLGRTVREVRAVAGLPLDVFSFDPREPRTTQRSSAISSKTSKPRRYPRW